jgi:hypothetical protein
MIRLMSVVALCATVGCSGSSEPDLDGGSPPSPSPTVLPETFAGAWQSVTPSLEFVRLSVSSKSSQQGVLGARLTLSGLAWEGSGRIEGDSLVLTMGLAGVEAPSGAMVVRASATGTLRAQLRPSAGQTTDLSFVRQD